MLAAICAGSYPEDSHEHQGLHRPHLAGNSLGGLVALEAGVRGLARSVTATQPRAVASAPGRPGGSGPDPRPSCAKATVTDVR